MEKAIETNELSYTYIKGGEIFKNCSFTLDRGKFYVLIGKNGVGKSTLLQILLGLRPGTGQVSILGLNPLLQHEQLMQKISYMSHGMELNDNISVKDFFSFYKLLYKNFSSQKLEKLSTDFNIDTEKYISQLSTGQRNKILIIAGISIQPELYIIDEMTAVLDPPSRDLFIELLDQDRKERNCSVLLATNVPDDVKDVVDKLLVVKDKNVGIFDKQDFNMRDL